MNEKWVLYHKEYFVVNFTIYNLSFYLRLFISCSAYYKWDLNSEPYKNLAKKIYVKTGVGVLFRKQESQLNYFEMRQG